MVWIFGCLNVGSGQPLLDDTESSGLASEASLEMLRPLSAFLPLDSSICKPSGLSLVQELVDIDFRVVNSNDIII